MNGLPGKLTIANIDGARAAGRDYIVYHGVKYTLKELEDGAGIKRAKPKPVVSKNVLGRKANYGDGESSEQRSDTRES